MIDFIGSNPISMESSVNLSEIVDRFAEDMPDQAALVFEDQTISYAKLLAFNK